MAVLSGKRFILRFLASFWCATTLLVAGCADFGNVPRWLALEEAPATPLGVVAPAERIARLRELADKGPESDDQQRQRVAEDLARAIHDEGDPLVRAEIIRTLGEYPGAAAAFDQAFAVYAGLPEAERPWRTLWYQTGPYWAYFYSVQYQRVIDLANTTLLETVSDPT